MAALLKYCTYIKVARVTDYFTVGFIGVLGNYVKDKRKCSRTTCFKQNEAEINALRESRLSCSG